MADTASDLFIDRLAEWGVDTVFGLPGDGINGFMEALRKRRDTIRYVHVRHGEVGAMAAVGYARDGRSRPVILAGQGARRADRAGRGPRRADRQGVVGQGLRPRRPPNVTGGIGVLGTRPTQEAMEGCDALVIVGSSMPYIEFLPQPGQAVCVQIDDQPERIGLRHPADVGQVGDARATLGALVPHLRRNEDRDLLERAQQGIRDWWSLMEQRGMRTETPMKPQVVAWHLAQLLEDDAIVCGDSGQVTYWVTQMLLRAEQRFVYSGTNCSMAAALPYAIGAQTAYPGRQVVAFTGDGSLTMQLGDLATLMQHELPVKVICLRNDTLGLIKWEQMAFLGNPEYGRRLRAGRLRQGRGGAGGASRPDRGPGDLRGAVARGARDTRPGRRRGGRRRRRAAAAGEDHLRAGQAHVRRAAPRRGVACPRRVLLWPDTFTDHFQPEVAIAATGALEHAGFAVVVPERPLCCGRPLYDFGMLTLARRKLRQVLDALRPELQAGTPVVALEPSCGAVFRDELAELFPDDEDAKRLTRATCSLGELLAREAPALMPSGFDRRALAHLHCHQRATSDVDGDRTVLDRLGLEYEVLDAGCCGLAGSFGYQAGEPYEVSMKAGERVLLPAVRDASADTLVISDGFSCRCQIELGAGHPALHLAQVVERALAGDPTRPRSAAARATVD